MPTTSCRAHAVMRRASWRKRRAPSRPRSREANGQTQRYLSVLAAYLQAKEVTLRRMYIETMQEVLTRSPALVVDDRLKGLVPFLQLNCRRRSTPAPPRPAGNQAAQSQGAPR